MPTSFIAGGVSISENRAPSIWQQNTDGWKARVHLPDANGKFPETKHTLMCGAAHTPLATHNARVAHHIGQENYAQHYEIRRDPVARKRNMRLNKGSFPMSVPGD